MTKKIIPQVEYRVCDICGVEQVEKEAISYSGGKFSERATLKREWTLDGYVNQKPMDLCNSCNIVIGNWLHSHIEATKHGK